MSIANIPENERKWEICDYALINAFMMTLHIVANKEELLNR